MVDEEEVDGGVVDGNTVDGGMAESFENATVSHNVALCWRVALRLFWVKATIGIFDFVL